MTDKILGFKVKDVKGCIWDELGTNKKTIQVKKVLSVHEEMDFVKKKTWHKFHKEVELLPVRLKSESVGIDWLESIVKRLDIYANLDYSLSENTQYIGYKKGLSDLLTAAKKEMGK